MKRWREARTKQATASQSDQLTDDLITAIEAIEDDEKRARLTESLVAGDVEFRRSEEFEGAVVHVGGVPVLEHRLHLRPE